MSMYFKKNFCVHAFVGQCGFKIYTEHLGGLPIQIYDTVLIPIDGVRSANGDFPSKKDVSISNPSG
jgi:hypothetical protein